MLLLFIDPTFVTPQSIGRMGELVVELELIARGWTVGNFNASTSNTPGWDLFAAKAGRSLKIRVKAKRPGTDCFRWSAKKDGSVLLGLEQTDKDDWVAAVSFTEDRAYDVYLIPSGVVERELRDNHAAYLAQPKRDGGLRKDSSQRNLFLDTRPDRPGHGYLNHWENYQNGWDHLIR